MTPLRRHPRIAARSVETGPASVGASHATAWPQSTPVIPPKLGDAAIRQSETPGLITGRLCVN